jgi:hypothetical protein
MKEQENLQPQDERKESSSADTKKQWQEPKLAFVKPKLTKHGDLQELTGFFGGFTPV